MTRHKLGDRSRSKKLTYLITGGLTVGVIAASGAYAFAGEHESSNESSQVKVTKGSAQTSEDGSDDATSSPTRTHKVKPGKSHPGSSGSSKPTATTTVVRPTPTIPPTVAPTTAKPTVAPTTAKPTPTTAKPTPTTAKPTVAPTTAKPTTTTVAPTSAS